jgi:site-specific recombinase XerD
VANFCTAILTWNTARKRAGLPDVRLHDLRHTFASLLINNGRSIYEVQRLLGHTQIKTTQRYAHLTQETLLDASNIGTAAMAATLGMGPHGDVIEGRLC